MALFKGLWRIDRERGFLPQIPLWGLLDRAVQNPYILFAAGLLMVGSGLAEARATLTSDLFVNRNFKLVHSLILFGTYGLLNSLPELFLGLRFMLKGVLPKQEVGDPEG